MEGSRMRIYRPLPIAVGLSLVLLTGVADATSTTCTTSVVCAEYINSSSGVAIHGEANTGIGIRGTSNGSTGFYGASRSGSPLYPGVEGESLDQTGDDAAGAFGLAGATGGTPPAYGVIAYGSAFGVYGDAFGPGNGTNQQPTSVGVSGVDVGGKVGADTNVGVFGQSTHGTGVLALANTSAYHPIGVFGYEPVGIYAEADAETSTNFGSAIGIQAVSDSTALFVENRTTKAGIEFGTQGGLIGSNHFNVDDAGDVSATQLTTNKGTYVRTTGSSGTTRMSYSARTTMPVMEDFGEAQLVNGRGYVKLDPALADVIDKRNTYYVFITPEGDSNGLYVTQKTPAGFVVREQHAGRATLAFQYRILAKPVDDDASRLALAPPLPRFERPDQHSDRGRSTATSVLPPDPLARLQSHLGPAAYARELKAARKIESGP
jgi:hypothetical protein